MPERNRGMPEPSQTIRCAMRSWFCSRWLNCVLVRRPSRRCTPQNKEVLPSSLWGKIWSCTHPLLVGYIPALCHVCGKETLSTIHVSLHKGINPKYIENKCPWECFRDETPSCQHYMCTRRTHSSTYTRNIPGFSSMLVQMRLHKSFQTNTTFLSKMYRIIWSFAHVDSW